MMETKQIGFFSEAPSSSDSISWAKIRQAFGARLAVIQRYASTLDQASNTNCLLCEYRPPQVTFVFGEFSWPASYKHYIERHHVEPPHDFYAFIVKQSVSRNAPALSQDELDYLNVVETDSAYAKGDRIVVAVEDGGAYPATVTTQRQGTVYFILDDDTKGNLPIGDKAILGFAKIKRQRKTAIEPDKVGEWV